MASVNWSLKAVDTIFSTREEISGEPECPQGTFPAGYVVDSWGKWRNLCLADLSIEDVEDVYLFGIMITGLLLIGIAFALIYHQSWKLEAAVKGLTPLPDMIEDFDKNQAIILEKVSAMQESLDRLSDQYGQ